MQQCDNNDGKDIEISQQLEEKHEDNRFECGLHPRNWCDNIESAMKCNAFDACVKNTWSKMNLNQVKLLKQNAAEAKSCSFCIYSHEKLQEILKEHPEEVHIKNYLTSACEILPSRELSDKCLSTVNVYFSQIHTLISNKIVNFIDINAFLVVEVLA